MDIRILIFGDRETTQRLLPILQDDDIKIVARTEDENKVLDEISSSKANMVLIASKDMNKLLRVSQQIYILRPRTIPIVITENYTPETMQQIIQTGVNNILPMQLEATRLLERIKNVFNNEASRLSALENSSTSDRKSQVITVFSSKGGVGTTSVVSNLAIKLANKKRRVCILDFDLEFGELASTLNLTGKNNIAELLESEESLNNTSIRKYLEMHISGVEVLAAPSSPEYADNIPSSSIEKIITVLRNYYDYILIDTKVGFVPVNLSCFDLSSRIIYVTGLDLSTMRRTKKGLSIINSIVDAEKVKLLVAKEEPSRVKLKDLSKALETTIWKSIPYDHKLALESINLGSPMVQHSPISKVAKAYERIADEIDGTKTEQKQARGFLDNILSKKQTRKPGKKKVKKRRSK